MDKLVENEALDELPLDERLSSTGLVGRDLFKQFLDAHIYGTVTPMQWLEGRLRVLRRRLEAGSTISVYDREAGGLRSCASVTAFAAWVSQYLPDTNIDER
jgi:hypothetical protein